MTHKRKRNTVAYTGLAGKVVERIDSYGEGEKVHLRVLFADKTELILAVAAQPKITNAQLVRWKAGNSSVVRSYRT